MTQDQLGFFTAKQKRRRGRYRVGLDTTIKALAAAGSLEPKGADAAVIALNRLIADAVDAAEVESLTGDESRYTVGTLSARAQAALELLLNREHDDDDDFLDDMLTRLAHPSNPSPPD